MNSVWPKQYSLLKGVCIYKNVVPKVKWEPPTVHRACPSRWCYPEFTRAILWYLSEMQDTRGWRQVEPLRTAWLARRANQKMWLEIILERHVRVKLWRGLNVKQTKIKVSRINTLNTKGLLMFLRGSVAGVPWARLLLPFLTSLGFSHEPCLQGQLRLLSWPAMSPVVYFQLLLISSSPDSLLLPSAASTLMLIHGGLVVWNDLPSVCPFGHL